MGTLAFSKRVNVVAILASGAVAQGQVSQAPATQPSFGRHNVRTLPLSSDIAADSETYTPSGKVLVAYSKPGAAGARDLNRAVVDGEGRHFRTFFSQPLPERAKDNGIRNMAFRDNRRKFLGDFT